MVIFVLVICLTHHRIFFHLEWCERARCVCMWNDRA